MTYHFYEELRWRIFWRCSQHASGTRPTGKNPVGRRPVRQQRPFWPFCYRSHGSHKCLPTPQLHLSTRTRNNKKKSQQDTVELTSHARDTEATTIWSSKLVNTSHIITTVSVIVLWRRKLYTIAVLKLIVFHLGKGLCWDQLQTSIINENPELWYVSVKPSALGF